jgi:hypothetical protein
MSVSGSGNCTLFFQVQFQAQKILKKSGRKCVSVVVPLKDTYNSREEEEEKKKRGIWGERWIKREGEEERVTERKRGQVRASMKRERGKMRLKEKEKGRARLSRIVKKKEILKCTWAVSGIFCKKGKSQSPFAILNICTMCYIYFVFSNLCMMWYIHYVCLNVSYILSAKSMLCPLLPFLLCKVYFSQVNSTQIQFLVSMKARKGRVLVCPYSYWVFFYYFIDFFMLSRESELRVATLPYQESLNSPSEHSIICSRTHKVVFFWILGQSSCCFINGPRCNINPE